LLATEFPERGWTWRDRPLAPAREAAHNPAIEPPIEHRDVTTIVALLGDIQRDFHVIRRLLENEYGEKEEAPEDDR